MPFLISFGKKCYLRTRNDRKWHFLTKLIENGIFQLVFEKNANFSAKKWILQQASYKTVKIKTFRRVWYFRKKSKFGGSIFTIWCFTETSRFHDKMTNFGGVFNSKNDTLTEIFNAKMSYSGVKALINIS